MKKILGFSILVAIFIMIRGYNSEEAKERRLEIAEIKKIEATLAKEKREEDKRKKVEEFKEKQREKKEAVIRIDRRARWVIKDVIFTGEYPEGVYEPERIIRIHASPTAYTVLPNSKRAPLEWKGQERDEDTMKRLEHYAKIAENIWHTFNGIPGFVVNYQENLNLYRRYPNLMFMVNANRLMPSTADRRKITKLSDMNEDERFIFDIIADYRARGRKIEAGRTHDKMTAYEGLMVATGLSAQESIDLTDDERDELDKLNEKYFVNWVNASNNWNKENKERAEAYRRGQWVRGHWRNGQWINGYYRSR